MKVKLFLFGALLINQLLIAQDTITKYSGEIIIAKVTAINPTDVNFKRFNSLDGPVYTEKKNDIASIKYKDGTVDYFHQTREIFSPKISKDSAGVYEPDKEDNKIVYVSWNYFGYLYKYHHQSVTFKEIHTILLNTKDPELAKMVRHARIDKGMRFLGLAAIPLEIGAIAFLSGPNATYDNGKMTGAATCFLAGIACPIIGGVLKHRYTKLTRKAIKIYNERY